MLKIPTCLQGSTISPSWSKTRNFFRQNWTTGYLQDLKKQTKTKNNLNIWSPCGTVKPNITAGSYHDGSVDFWVSQTFLKSFEQAGLTSSQFALKVLISASDTAVTRRPLPKHRKRKEEKKEIKKDLNFEKNNWIYPPCVTTRRPPFHKASHSH